MCAREDPSNNCPMCNMVSALSFACEQAGVTVNWQADSELRGLCAGKEQPLLQDYTGVRGVCLCVYVCACLGGYNDTKLILTYLNNYMLN